MLFRSHQPREGNVTPVAGLVVLPQYELVSNPEFVSYYYQCAGPCVAMDPKYIYLVECTLNTLSIYFSLTFRSHATKPHKLHGCPPHHIIHTTLIEKKINHPKQDLPVFCSYDVVSCTYLLVV